MLDHTLITEDDARALAHLPTTARGEALLKGQAGPLGRIVAGQYNAPSAAFAMLLCLAYRQSRAGGMLSGRPGYEARETFGHRARAAAARAQSLDEYAVDLFRDVGGQLAKLDADSAVWWRQAAAVYAAEWPRLKRRERIEEALTGAALVDDWLYEIPKFLKPKQEAP